ncbi:MAG: TetR/AcrR family transcriptional regulator [Sulfitobacter sp.]
MNKTRLSPNHWLTAGFDALQHLGPQALAAEPLARRLGTTKGSFYWHFKDVPAFHAALLNQWRQNTLVRLANLTDQSESSAQSLREFGKDLLNDPSEASMRNWAVSNADVATMLQEIDRLRLNYIAALLRQVGFGNANFAHALLAALLGLPQVLPDQPDQRAAAFDTLLDTVLALS